MPLAHTPHLKLSFVTLSFLSPEKSTIIIPVSQRSLPVHDPECSHGRGYVQAPLIASRPFTERMPCSRPTTKPFTRHARLPLMQTLLFLNCGVRMSCVFVDFCNRSDAGNKIGIGEHNHVNINVMCWLDLRGVGVRVSTCTHPTRTCV